MKYDRLLGERTTLAYLESAAIPAYTTATPSATRDTFRVLMSLTSGDCVLRMDAIAIPVSYVTATESAPSFKRQDS